MLAMASNNYYPSTTHRVVNPDAGQNVSRYSMPMFLHPCPEVFLQPGMTADDYLQQRLRGNRPGRHKDRYEEDNMMRLSTLIAAAAIAISSVASAADIKPAVVYDMGGKFDKSFNEGVWNGAFKSSPKKPVLR